MPKIDPRIDAYLAKAPPFARPILVRLREVVHEACPDVVETMKWSRPAFDYHGLLCNMSAFKAHCAFGFWKHELVVPAAARKGAAAGQLGRLTSVDELPTRRVLAGWIRTAMKLNRDGVPAPHVSRRKSRPELPVPEDLRAALARVRRARAAFEAFTPGRRREYIEWITEAKTAVTRERRLEQALEWIAEGKHRNWKYEKC